VTGNVRNTAGESDIEKIVEGFNVRGGKAMEFAHVGFFTGVGTVEGGDWLTNFVAGAGACGFDAFAAASDAGFGAFALFGGDGHDGLCSRSHGC